MQPARSETSRFELLRKHKLTQQQLEDNYRHLLIETAANRLVLRALILNFIMLSGTNAEKLSHGVNTALEAMAPQALRLRGMSLDVQAAAISLVRGRAASLLADFCHPIELEGEVDRPPMQERLQPVDQLAMPVPS